MSERSTPRYTQILSSFVLAGGVICCLVAVYFCIHFYTAAPFADSWNILDEIVMNHGKVSPGMLWALHNEHRIAIPKLLMWADIFWMRDKGISLFLEIYLVQFFFALLLVYAVRRLGRWSWLEQRTTFGVALFCLFCPAQWEIFIWSFGIQVVLAYALAALAVIALTRYSMEGKRVWFTTAIVTSFAAPFLLAGGVVLWPVLCIVGWTLRVKVREIATIAVCGVISISTYMIGYVRPIQHADTMESLRHPGKLAQYVLLYFGGSWEVISRPMGYGLAAVAILAVLGWSVRGVIKRAETPLRGSMLGLALSLIANALLTAIGRINFGIEQATASRYQTSALLFWCCIFILGMDVLRQLSPKFAATVMALILVVMAVAATHTAKPWHEAAFWAERIEIGTLPLLADVKDDAVVSANLIGTPLWIFRDTGFLREHGMSIYDSDEYRRIGVLLTEIYQVTAPGRCQGFFDSTSRVADAKWPGYRASGWGWDRVLARPLMKIVLTNEAGRITGAGRGGLQRVDVKQLVPGITSSFTGWWGYVDGAFEWRTGQAYGELPGGREVCAIPGTAARP